MILLVCCRGRGRCARMDPRAALAHAAQRSRKTGRDQNIRHRDGMWRITEALPRRKREENMRVKYDVDGVQLTDGDQVTLLDSEDLQGPPVLLLKIVDLQDHTPMVKVEVVQLLEHQHAHLFGVGEVFEALPLHLSRRLATSARPA